ncbi:MAG: diguanylate cyclase [Myxococcota bacterium]
MVEVLPLAELTYVSGPAAGHRILRWMVGMVTHHTREFDVVARLGGAELGLVLPSTDVSGTSALAERLLETLRREDERPPLPEGITLEVALGAATAPVHGETPVELVMAAEERLITGRGVDSVRFGVSAA